MWCLSLAVSDKVQRLGASILRPVASDSPLARNTSMENGFGGFIVGLSQRGKFGNRILTQDVFV